MPFSGLTTGGDPARAQTGESLVRVVNPLAVSDWDEQVRQLPGSTFFHGTPWLRVLKDTYGFEPCCVVAPGTDALPRVPDFPEDARDTQERVPTGFSGLLPLVEVQSWLTGKRGVALPFADFCPPLAKDKPTEQALIAQALALGHDRHWRYLECRGTTEPLKHRNTETPTPDHSTDHRPPSPVSSTPLTTDPRPPSSELCPPSSTPHSPLLAPRSSLSFYRHTLSLSPGQEALFKSFESSVRRAIRKAEQSGVTASVTTSEAAMDVFHQLYCLTRQKHGLPPQPWKFFAAVQRHIIATGQGFIVEAAHEGRPVASAVFFTSGRQGLYKYGASDHTAQELRANNLVMWTAIKHLISKGFESLDFGRTSLDNEGLRRFKNSWNVAEEMLDYCRYDYRENTYVKQTDSAQGWHTRLFRHLPISLARIIGALLYKHTA